jgi:2-dehydro-3-deoxyphosphogluconate aldolase/(4S)-4-hydroxy-2-oxoglutarate aldolase
MVGREGCDEALRRILACGLVPGFSAADERAARGVSGAIAGGGCDVLEFFNRGPGALDVFVRLAAWAKKALPGILLGAGTITNQEEAWAFSEAGAAFLVGPNLDLDVARFCAERDMLYVPGCGTATEVSQAFRAGLRLVKLFPARELGGLAFLKALLGPFPGALFMPSGGVDTDADSLARWFAAGAACVSVGGALVSEAIIANEDWATLRADTARVMGVVRRFQTHQDERGQK